VDSNLYSEGPLLITHWGMSAPAILKLSAFGALELAKRDYKFHIEINPQIDFNNPATCDPTQKSPSESSKKSVAEN